MSDETIEEKQQKKMREFVALSEAEQMQKSQGKSMSSEQLEEAAWCEKKNQHVATLTESELARIMEEKKQKRLAWEKEQVETAKAREHVDKTYWEDLQKSCLEGSPIERFARCLVRLADKNLLIKTMGDPAEKTQRVAQLLRLHALSIKDSKGKPSAASFQDAASLFSMDPFVQKGDVIQTRRVMFPEARPGNFPIIQTKTQEK